jgi:hypothetical protein
MDTKSELVNRHNAFVVIVIGTQCAMFHNESSVTQVINEVFSAAITVIKTTTKRPKVTETPLSTD